MSPKVHRPILHELRLIDGADAGSLLYESPVSADDNNSTSLPKVVGSLVLSDVLCWFAGMYRLFTAGVFAQKSFDEEADVAVQDCLGIAGFSTCAMVFDHIIRMEDI